MVLFKNMSVPGITEGLLARLFCGNRTAFDVMVYWGLPLTKPVGLRTEIIFHITLLLGAALLFGGFLMLKLTERELLNQRLDNLKATLDVMAFSVGDLLAREATESGRQQQIAGLFSRVPEATALGVWEIQGETLVPLYGWPSQESWLREAPLPQSLRYLSEAQDKLVYRGAWLFWGEPSSCYFESSVPIRQRGKILGVLHARFPLNEVAVRVRSSLKILLLYVALYGTVLFLFGVYLLNRNVVRPIGLLLATTRRVAEGDLDQQLSEAGPREIASLARSFNAMIAALRQSRQNSEEHIRSLQRSNEALQQSRSELFRSEKMATVGHLAAGMAHEVGNPLAAVVGYLALLKTELPTGRQREIAEYAAVEVERIDRLVRELLDYARPGEETPQRFDPLSVLQEALSLLEHQGLFADVELTVEVPRQVSEVQMIRHRLLQVFVNLLVNARDALFAGGVIRITGGETESSVWVGFADNGAGIGKKDLPHIFDPFFTTKAPGKGRGLGLAVCYRVLEEAGGRIEVHSEEGRGCLFKVYMPKKGGAHGG